MPTAGPPRQREIRVFISSTFRDMQEEREELVKQVFPQLRRLCESRGVTWGEVDLRWGVPDEARAEGAVLPLCLAEIDRCRPYFIGLLGERYGWVPDEIPPALLESQPWLDQHCTDSVTALEIQHGVLRNPAMADRAFFYFRNPQYAADQRGFTEEDPTRRARLSQLKDEIRASRLPVAENFASPQELGERVLRDLTAVIEDLYPESSIPDPLDRAAADHEAYAASRRRVYIGRPEYLARLDAHAAGDGRPLVVLGESGGGKSALLANWVHRWRGQHPDTLALVHFIGAAPESADWMAMLRRLLGEFRRIGVQFEIPDQPDALRMTFANALHMVAARTRVVLVLDALNQIEDRDGARDLVWLPPVIPPNVRLIASTLDASRIRGWEVLRVEPLSPPERETLIVDYLQQYAKQLSPHRRRRIADAAQSANGLYLTTLLNELRLFGSHDEIDHRIAWYLEARSPFELYGKVIHRWEQDYNFVRETLVQLWAARHGLSETELLESLGSVPRAAWTPLFLAAADALVNRGGLLTFAHDFLRDAVRDAYLPTKDHQRSAHRGLAAYFGGQPPGLRQLDELPWQLQEASEWQGLSELLAQPLFFETLWQANEFEAMAYWTRIERESSLLMEQVYSAAMDQPAGDSSHAWRIGLLLGDTGKTDAALRVHADLVALFRERSDRAGLSGALGNQGVILQIRGDLDPALALHNEEERLCRELGDENGVQRALGRQAMILQNRGDLEDAMNLLMDQERLCRELGNKKGLQRALSGQAMILNARGDLDGAMALHKEEERLCRELGKKDSLAATLGNQALILEDRGDLNGAMALLKEVERLCRELGNKYILSSTLGNQALILRGRGDLDGAMALHKEEERLCRELGNKQGLSGTLSNQALILEALGESHSALALHREAERLCRELGNKHILSATLVNQGSILQARGELDSAMALYREAEYLCRELGYKRGLSVALGNQGLLLKARGEIGGAMALHLEEERLCRELGNKDGLQRTLGNQAAIFHENGDIDRAVALLREQEQICLELANPYGPAFSLANQAETLRTIPGRRREARQLADQALAIATRHGYRQLAPKIQHIRDSILSGAD